MPRSGGVYSKPAGTTAVANTKIKSAKYNQLMDDIVEDLNNPRPITVGGTGATTASGARSAIGAAGTGDNNTFTGDNTFVGDDTISGNPTLSGNPAFTGSPDFSGVSNAATIRSDIGLTPADILAYLITVDGGGSNLDADMLDGKHASSFYQKSDWSMSISGENTNGYVIMPNGFTLQWGHVADLIGATLVTLPLSFTNHTGGLAGGTRVSPVDGTVACYYEPEGNNTATVVHDAERFSGSSNVQWFAWGRIV